MSRQSSGSRSAMTAARAPTVRDRAVLGTATSLRPDHVTTRVVVAPVSIREPAARAGRIPRCSGFEVSCRRLVPSR
jgi:hypothetical protein